MIAIDPGNIKSAIVRKIDNKLDTRYKLNHEIATILEFAPVPENEEIIIEMVASYGMPVGRTVFDTCVWIGVFMEIARRKKLTIRLLERKQIKLELCGQINAKDSNIRQRLIDIYGGEQKAIGGKKCQKCKGKGWFGAGRPVCPECNGAKWKYPPGPLKDFSGDQWAALAVLEAAKTINDRGEYERYYDLEVK